MRTMRLLVASAAVLMSTVMPIENAHAWGRFDGGDHPAFNKRYVREKPVVIHNNYVNHDSHDHDPHGGCAGCGFGVAAVAGLVSGVIIGSAIANSGDQGPPPEVVEAPQPVIVQAPPQYVQGLPLGTEVSSLPPGCANMNVNGATYYQCGPIWYQPFFGGNGVYYTVVQAP